MTYRFKTLLTLPLFGWIFNVYAVDEQLNMQGITGAINTPSANTLQPGTFDFLYSKQVERSDGYFDYHSFTFAVGLYDFLEVSGRNASYTNDLGLSSDLSANLKVKVPYIPKEWFSLALGVQDLGGAANHFDSDYVVMSKSLFEQQLSVSLGVGRSDSALGRLDGAFGSIRYQPFEWMQLDLEHDAADSHFGMKLLSPLSWFDSKLQLHSSIIFTSSNDDLTDNAFYGLGFTLPLSTSVEQKLKSHSVNYIVNSSENEKQEKALDELHETNLFAELKQFKKRLVDFGFEDLSVGYKQNNLIYISVSSLSTFGRNRLDAVGFILGTLADSVNGTQASYHLALTENGILTEAYQGELATYKQFMQGHNLSGLTVLSESITTDMVTWIGEQEHNSSWLKPRITIAPEFSTTMGTEVGMFDMSAALSTQVQFNLWQGATLQAKTIKQFYETKDFKDGYVYADSKQQDGLDELGISQSFKLPYNLYNMSTIGRYRGDFDFIRNESYWASQNGKHRVELMLGKYFNDELGPATITCNRLFQVCLDLIEASRIKFEEPSVQVLGYKYYIPNYDLLVRLDAGKYWQADTGFTAELERQFGDTTIRLRYKNTDSKDGINNQFIGLSFSVPLTPRREFNTRYATIRGPNKFTYGVSTLIGKDHNQLTPGTGDIAFIANQNLGNLYFNNHRSGQAYLDRNQERLREVYFTYKDAE